MKEQKNILIVLISFFLFLGKIQSGLAQNVGINSAGAAPDVSAMLDVVASGKGILIPRVALTSSIDAATIPTPAASLLVYNLGTGGLSPAGYFYNSGTSGSPVWVQLLNGGSPGTAWLLSGNTNTNSPTNFLGTADAQDLVFKTNNTERMRILSGGNVGIGTTNPIFHLDVQPGTSNAITRVGPVTFIENVTSNQSMFSRNAYFDGTTWKYATAGYATAIRMNDDINATGDIRFHLSPNAAAGSTITNMDGSDIKMTIQNNGNVGIGTTTPSTLLHVNRNSSQIPGTIVTIENDNAGTQAYAGVDVLSDNAGIDMRTYGSGWNGFFTHGGFNLAQKAELWAQSHLVAGMPDALLIGISSPAPIIFCTTDAEHMRLDANGNLGIATANPEVKLHIYGGAGSSDLLTVGEGSGINERGMVIGYNYNSDYAFLQSTHQGSGFKPISLNPNGGNVGIGTSTPGNNLTVYNAGSASPIGAMSIDVGSFNNFANSQASYFFRVRDVGAATTLFYIQGDGNVGIGCTSPQYKLHVMGDIASSGTVRGVNAYVTGAITACSDIRYKKDIVPLQNSLNTVLKLQGVNYKWKKEEFPEKNFSEDIQIGFIAQEIEKLYPQLVFTDKDGYKSVDYSRVSPILVEAIKDLYAEFRKSSAEQQKIIKELKLENSNLAARVKSIEAVLNSGSVNAKK
jgi:hypothetical protein